MVPKTFELLPWLLALVGTLSGGQLIAYPKDEQPAIEMVIHQFSEIPELWRKHCLFYFHGAVAPDPQAHQRMEQALLLNARCYVGTEGLVNGSEPGAKQIAIDHFALWIVAKSHWIKTIFDHSYYDRGLPMHVAANEALKTFTEVEQSWSYYQAKSFGFDDERLAAYVYGDPGRPPFADARDLKRKAEQLVKEGVSRDYETAINHLLYYSRSYLDAWVLRNHRESIETSISERVRVADYQPQWFDSLPYVGAIRQAAYLLQTYARLNAVGLAAVDKLVTGLIDSPDPVTALVARQYIDRTGAFTNLEDRLVTAGTLMLQTGPNVAFDAGVLVASAGLAAIMRGASVARALAVGYSGAALLNVTHAPEIVGSGLASAIEATFGKSTAAQYAAGIIANSAVVAAPIILLGPRAGMTSWTPRLTIALSGSAINNVRLYLMVGCSQMADGLETSEASNPYEKAKAFNQTSSGSAVFIVAALAGSRFSNPGFAVGLQVQDSWGDLEQSLSQYQTSGNTQALLLRLLATGLDAGDGAIGAVLSKANILARLSHIKGFRASSSLDSLAAKICRPENAVKPHWTTRLAKSVGLNHPTLQEKVKAMLAQTPISDTAEWGQRIVNDIRNGKKVPLEEMVAFMVRATPSQWDLAARLMDGTLNRGSARSLFSASRRGGARRSTAALWEFIESPGSIGTIPPWFEVALHRQARQWVARLTWLDHLQEQHGINLLGSLANHLQKRSERSLSLQVIHPGEILRARMLRRLFQDIGSLKNQFDGLPAGYSLKQQEQAIYEFLLAKHPVRALLQRPAQIVGTTFTVFAIYEVVAAFFAAGDALEEQEEQSDLQRRGMYKSLGIDPDALQAIAEDPNLTIEERAQQQQLLIERSVQNLLQQFSEQFDLTSHQALFEQFYQALRQEALDQYTNEKNALLRQDTQMRIELIDCELRSLRLSVKGEMAAAEAEEQTLQKKYQAWREQRRQLLEAGVKFPESMSTVDPDDLNLPYDFETAPVGR